MKINGYGVGFARTDQNARAHNITTPILKKNEYDSISFSGKVIKPKKNFIKNAVKFIVALFNNIKKLWDNYSNKEFELLYKKGPFNAAKNNNFHY